MFVSLILIQFFIFIYFDYLLLTISICKMLFILRHFREFLKALYFNNELLKFFEVS